MVPSTLFVRPHFLKSPFNFVRWWTGFALVVAQQPVRQHGPLRALAAHAYHIEVRCANVPHKRFGGDRPKPRRQMMKALERACLVLVSILGRQLSLP